MMYLGDYAEDQPVYFAWNTSDSDGASITRSGDGTISVYKDASNGTAFDTTQVTTGITNDEDFDGLTGVHTCSITTTDAWYETGHDYMVVLSGSTIDTQTVNVVLAHFSIENRFMRGTDSAATAAALTTHDGKLDTVDTNVDSILADTDDIGVAGAGLTAVPWNSAWDSEVQSECADALTAYDPPTRAELTTDKNSIITEVNANETKIDALNDISSADVNAACDTALSDYGANTTTPPTVGAIRTEMEGAGSKLLAIETDTNELQANQGDWATATGFSTHDAGDIWDELKVDHVIADSYGDYLDDEITSRNATTPPTAVEIRQEMDSNSVDLNSILTDTNELQTNQGNWLTATGFNTVVPDAAGVAPTAVEIRQEMDANSTRLDADISSRAPANEYDTEMAHLDVDVSSRNSTTPPTVIEIRTEMDTNSTKMAPSQTLADYKATGFSTHSAASIWSVGTRSLTDKAGFSLSTAGIKGIWDQLTSALTTVGSAGKLIADNINATITSRAPANEYDTEMGYIPSDLGDVPIASELNSAHGAGSWEGAGSAPTVSDIVDGVWDELKSGHTTPDTFGDYLDDEITSRAPANEYDTEMAHLDADVSSRNATTPPTVTAIRQEMDTNSTDLNAILNDTNELQTNQGNWITATGFSTHSAASVWSVGTRALTDKAGFALSTAGIKAIWDQLTNVLTTVGSTGKLIVDNINATISSRNSVTPDPAGTAATLHTATDGLITTVDGVCDTIAIDVAGLDGEAMRGTDSANTTTPPTVTQIRTEMDTNSTKMAPSQNLADYKATGFNTVTPDPAGTAATLHTATDGLITTVDGVCDTIAIDVAGLDGDVMRGTDGANTTTPPTVGEIRTEMEGVGTKLTEVLIDTTGLNGDVMRGTDGANTTVPDAAGTAAGLHTTTDAKIDTVDGIVDDILVDTGTTLPARFDGVEGATFATGTDSLEAIRDRGDTAWLTGGAGSITVDDIVAGIFDRVTEGTLTFEEMQRIGFAVLAGKSSGGCTDTGVFRNHADTKDRVVATFTAHGNRTAVVLDGSD